MLITKDKIKDNLTIINYFNYKGYKYEENGNLSRGISKPVMTYRLIEHDSLVFTEKKYWWNSRGSSGDIFDLIMEFENLSFKNALRELGNIYLHKDNLTSCFVEREVKDVKYGDEYGKINNVIAYLSQKRKIDINIINKLRKDNYLITDENNNACFVIRNYLTRQIVGYEKNGVTEKRYKNISAEKEYGVGFNIIYGQPKKVIFFESAIDLISYSQLKPEKLIDVVLVSLSGLKDSIILKVLRDFDINNITLAVDNDKAGLEFIEKTRSELVDVKVDVDIPRSTINKDWNAVLVSNSSNKGSKYTF